MSNTVLVQHGIQTEESDVRCHVCPWVRRIYVFPTSAGVEAIRCGTYQLLNARQAGVDVVTSQGYNVPPDDIIGCVALCLPERTWKAIAFDDGDGLGTRGRKALSLVKAMIHQGLLPLPGMRARGTDYSLEIRGMDLIVITASQERTVQVKCDYKGGDPSLGGYGLFLQIAECNPLGVR